MKRSLLMHILAAILLLVAISACASAPKSFKESILDDMYPIFTVEEYEKIELLETKEDILKSLDEYWETIDSIPGLSGSQFRTEYEQRLEYANKHYPDRRGWGRSDRKRVYLIYGPPTYVEKQEFTDYEISKFSKIKALEIWFYMSPANNNSLPTQLDRVFNGEKKFMFADMIGAGFFKAIYSSEESEYVDDRIILDVNSENIR